MGEDAGCGLGRHKLNLDFSHKTLDLKNLEGWYDVEENPHRVYRQPTIRFSWTCKKCRFIIYADVPSTIIAAFGGSRDENDRWMDVE